jgi:hypothetical protein
MINTCWQMCGFFFGGELVGSKPTQSWVLMAQSGFSNCGTNKLVMAICGENASIDSHSLHYNNSWFLKRFKLTNLSF